MRDDVRTRWHDWLDAYRLGNVMVDSERGAYTIACRHPAFVKDKLDVVAECLHDLPHYFLTESALGLLNDVETVYKSLSALLRAGMVELRDDVCVVEFDLPDGRGGKDRYFVAVTRREWAKSPSEAVFHPYRCDVFRLYQPDYTTGKMREVVEAVEAGRAVKLWNGDRPKYFASASQTSIMLAIAEDGMISHQGTEMRDGDFHFGVIPAPWTDTTKIESYMNSRGPPTAFEEDSCFAARIAVTTLVLLLRTRGVERSEVVPAKLNKARASRGATRIPDHTVVQLGYYFKRSGERVKYDPTKPGHKFQEVHMRSPHVQGYWVGPRGEAKLVEKYVEAYLVNYVDGDPLPKPKRKVVRYRGDAGVGQVIRPRGSSV